MFCSILLPVFFAAASVGDTVLVLGRVERDLTGDGHPEMLRLIGTGRTIDTLNVTFSITSRGQLLYEERLSLLARTPGFDPHRGQATSAQHRAKLSGFGAWFFRENSFTSPEGFVAMLRESGPEHIPLIPQVIDRDRATGSPSDTARAAATWDAIQRSDPTVFVFSPGGDRVRAIAWSEEDRRFYQLWECC